MASCRLRATAARTDPMFELGILLRPAFSPWPCGPRTRHAAVLLLPANQRGGCAPHAHSSNVSEENRRDDRVNQIVQSLLAELSIDEASDGFFAGGRMRESEGLASNPELRFEADNTGR